LSRPPIVRETGSGEKLGVWLRLSRKTPAFLGKRSGLPSTRVIKQWIKVGIPVDGLRKVAGCLEVPVELLVENVSLRTFEDDPRVQKSIRLEFIPDRAPTTARNVTSHFRAFIGTNSNFPKVFSTVCDAHDAKKPVSYDDIALEVGISEVAVREIVNNLMQIRLLKTRDNPGHPGFIELTSLAIENRFSLQKLIRESDELE